MGVLLPLLVTASMLTACGGGSEAADTTHSPATTAGTATTTVVETTVVPETTIPAVTTTTTTIPSSAAIAGIVGDGAVLGDCDWPETYPDGSEAVIVSWTDVDEMSADLLAMREERGLPAWAMPATSAEMDDPKLWGYAHRVIDFPGTTLVSGAYLFATEDIALSALEMVDATFNDAEAVSRMTGGIAGLDEVIQRQPQENGAAVTVQSAAGSPYVPTVILAEAQVIGSLLVVFHAAVPWGADDSRFRAAMDAATRLVTRAFGSPVPYPTEALGTAVDLTTIALGTDPWAGAELMDSGTPPSWSPAEADAVGALYAANGIPAAELASSGAAMTAAGMTRMTYSALQTGDGALLLYSGHQIYADADAAAAGFAAVSGAQADPAASQPFFGTLAIDSTVALDEPALGDEAAAVVHRSGDTLDVVGVAWRSGSDVQWLRARILGPDGTGADKALVVAAAMADRLGSGTITDEPALNPGCIPVAGSGEALLDATPWLTALAVLADGDPWVEGVSGATETMVVSYEDAQGFGDAEWTALHEIREAWNQSWEIPDGIAWFENEWNPIRSVAFRHVPGTDGGPALWTVAVRYAEGTLGEELGGESFKDVTYAQQGFWGVSNDLGIPGTLGRLSGSDQAAFITRYPIATPVIADTLTSGLSTGPDLDVKAAFLVWKRGDVVQWVRVLMPASDTSTLDAMIAVAEAMAARSE